LRHVEQPRRLGTAPHGPHRRARLPVARRFAHPHLLDRRASRAQTWWKAATRDRLDAPGELAGLTDSGSLNLSAGDDGQPGAEAGTVVIDGELYVRAYRRAQSGWYRAAREHGHGRIRVGAVARDVLLQIPDEIGPADAIDAAYQAKYGNTSAIATTPQARDPRAPASWPGHARMLAASRVSVGQWARSG
jgi:hypothetical protein